MASEAPVSVDESYSLVEDDDTLATLCDEWRKCDCLAVDTEFIRTTTFFPRAGLIQVNDGKANYLLDPLCLTEWEAFRQLMTSRDTVKIFHSCSEDLQVFMAALELVPEPVFDTQIAAAFLNDGFSCSYQALVKNCLGIDLPKEETRSDWLQRPLDEKQCHYAAHDVACLPAIYRAQHSALQETGKLAWFQEECESLLALYKKEMTADFADYYLNIRGAWQLDRQQLAVLQKLAQWRELRARKRDKPRNWIIRDKELMEIARLAPANTEQLRSIDGLGKNFLRYEGKEVIRLVAEALTIPEDSWPGLLPRPLGGSVKSRLRKGQQFAEEVASRHDLPVELLMRKRWLTSLLQNLKALDSEDSPELPDELGGWRKALLFPGLLEAIG